MHLFIVMFLTPPIDYDGFSFHLPLTCMYVNCRLVSNLLYRLAINESSIFVAEITNFLLNACYVGYSCYPYKLQLTHLE